MAPYRPGPSWPKIKRRLRGYKNELVQLLRELTAIPALGPENGGEGEQAKARYLLQVMVSAVSRKTGARITYEVVNAVQAPPPPGGGLDDHPGNGPSAE